MKNLGNTLIISVASRIALLLVATFTILFAVACEPTTDSNTTGASTPTPAASSSPTPATASTPTNSPSPAASASPAAAAPNAKTKDTK